MCAQFSFSSVGNVNGNIVLGVLYYVEFKLDNSPYFDY